MIYIFWTFIKNHFICDNERFPSPFIIFTPCVYFLALLHWLGVPRQCGIEEVSFSHSHCEGEPVTPERWEYFRESDGFLKGGQELKTVARWERTYVGSEWIQLHGNSGVTGAKMGKELEAYFERLYLFERHVIFWPHRRTVRKYGCGCGTEECWKTVSLQEVDQKGRDFYRMWKGTL